MEQRLEAVEGFVLKIFVFTAKCTFGTFGVGLAGFEAEFDHLVLDAGVCRADAPTEAFVGTAFPASARSTKSIR